MKHSEISELLPWYANSTLGEEEREKVEAHLANCPECAREAESLAIMQRAIVEIGNSVEPSPRLRFERALNKIEEYEQAKASRDRAHRGASIREWLAKLVRDWASSAPLWSRATIAVQAVLLLCLSGAVLYERHIDRIYTTASAPSGDKASTRIVVSFNDNATEQQMKQAVQAVHGKIVDGPSALGLYTIEVPIPAEHSTEVQGVLETLRKDDHVIRFAEQKP